MVTADFKYICIDESKNTGRKRDAGIIIMKKPINMYVRFVGEIYFVCMNTLETYDDTRKEIFLHHRDFTYHESWVGCRQIIGKTVKIIIT